MKIFGAEKWEPCPSERSAAGSASLVDQIKKWFVGVAGLR